MPHRRGVVHHGRAEPVGILHVVGPGHSFRVARYRVRPEAASGTDPGQGKRVEVPVRQKRSGLAGAASRTSVEKSFLRSGRGSGRYCRLRYRRRTGFGRDIVPRALPISTIPTLSDRSKCSVTCAPYPGILRMRVARIDHAASSRSWTAPMMSFSFGFPAISNSSASGNTACAASGLRGPFGS